jgi:hypothetical protein
MTTPSRRTSAQKLSNSSERSGRQVLTAYQCGHCGMVRANCHLTLAMFDGQLIEGKHPALIDEATWDRCLQVRSAIAGPRAARGRGTATRSRRCFDAAVAAARCTGRSPATGDARPRTTRAMRRAAIAPQQCLAARRATLNGSPPTSWTMRSATNCRRRANRRRR